MLKSIFLWFYRLDYPAVLTLLAAAVCVYRALRGRIPSDAVRRGLALAALMVWLAAVIGQTVWTRTPRAYPAPVWAPFQSYADALKEGGQPELLRSNFMNAVLFFPGGLFLAELLPGSRRTWWKAAAAALALGILSVGIEWAQLRWGLGLTQTDDVIHNTLGALLGAVAAILPGIGGGKQISEDDHGSD